MTGCEKILAALSADGSPEVPVVFCYPGIFERDHLVELTDLPWWYGDETDPARRAALQASLVNATGCDWYWFGPGASHEEQAAVCIVETADGVEQVDARTGVHRRLRPPVVSGTLSTVSDAAPTFDDVEAFLAERITLPLDTGFEPGRGDYPAHLRAALPDKCPVVWAATPQWMLAGLMGYEQWFTWLALDPARLRGACDRLLELELRRIRTAATIGAEVIWIEDCLTDQIGPARFRHDHLPALRALTEAIRAAGLAGIHYFCGNPWPVWEMLMDTGADAISLEESKKSFRIDIDEVVTRVDGRMAILGNLDAIGVLEQGTTDELAAEVTRQLAAGCRTGGRFIMSTGSPITPATPAVRVREYAAMARKAVVPRGR
jgi:hypothetical protein